MKILTLNTWTQRGPWERRWDVICRGIGDLQPDIIGFQELFDHAWAGEVMKRTGYEHAVFGPPASGLVIFSRYAVQAEAVHTMKTQSPTEDYRRFAIFAGITINECPLAFFNTHLTWRLDEGSYREKQVEELLNFIAVKGDAHETAAVGDFNSPPDQPAIQNMIKKGKFLDVYEAKHPGTPGLTWDNRNPFCAEHSMPDRRLDYIFVRQTGTFLSKPASVELVFNKPDADGVYASDHYGVLATFEKG